jgi:hypothetical protein
MSDFNALAELHRLEMTRPDPTKALSGPRMVHTGTVAECVRKVMAKREPDRQIYSMTVKLEAGFGGPTLHYREIEQTARRADFPKS